MNKIYIYKYCQRCGSINKDPVGGPVCKLCEYIEFTKRYPNQPTKYTQYRKELIKNSFTAKKIYINNTRSKKQ